MRDKETSTRVIFVRHGKTDFPTDRIYCDEREDPALNAEGRRQAAAAAALLKDHAIDCIVCSPAARTRATAEAIVSVTGVPLSENDGLRERRFGVWDGLYFNEIERGFPDDYLSWKKDPAGFTPRGGETMYDLRARVAQVINTVISSHAHKTVVVVSHVGPIRMALSDALGLSLDRYRRLTVDYGALSRVDYGRRQHNLIYLNCHSRHF